MSTRINTFALMLALAPSTASPLLAQGENMAEVRAIGAGLRMQVAAVHIHCPGASSVAMEKMAATLVPPPNLAEITAANEEEQALEKTMTEAELCQSLAEREAKAQAILNQD